MFHDLGVAAGVVLQAGLLAVLVWALMCLIHAAAWVCPECCGRGYVFGKAGLSKGERGFPWPCYRCGGSGRRWNREA